MLRVGEAGSAFSMSAILHCLKGKSLVPYGCELVCVKCIYCCPHSRVYREFATLSRSRTVLMSRTKARGY